jgi:hypothetical protein
MSPSRRLCLQRGCGRLTEPGQSRCQVHPIKAWSNRAGSIDISVQPGGRTGLFERPEAIVLGHAFCWLADIDWRDPFDAPHPISERSSSALAGRGERLSLADPRRRAAPRREDSRRAHDGGVQRRAADRRLSWHSCETGTGCLFTIGLSRRWCARPRTPGSAAWARVSRGRFGSGRTWWRSSVVT